MVSLKVFKVFVDETTENCYANYKVNRNFIYLITKSRRKLVRNMAKAVRMADIAQRLGISTVSVSKGLAGKEGVSAEMRAKILATAEAVSFIEFILSAHLPLVHGDNIPCTEAHIRLFRLKEPVSHS